MADNLSKYIKDSLINGRIAVWDKDEINFYIADIVSNMKSYEKERYYEIIRRAAKIWSETGVVKLVYTETRDKADIVVNWTKVGRVFEGNCKYVSLINSRFRRVAIEIGLPNEYSPKIVSDDTILHTALHEFGHALGLGHGIDSDDVMFVPHQKTLNKISKNDYEVLRFLYSKPAGEIISQ